SVAKPDRLRPAQRAAAGLRRIPVDPANFETFLPAEVVSSMSRLSGKTALVTGGGSGIGLAVARAFLQEGARVIISGRNEDKLAQAARHLQGGDRLSYHAADVGDPEQVRRLVEEATRRGGRIDILVNNAGLNIKE